MSAVGSFVDFAWRDGLGFGSRFGNGLAEELSRVGEVKDEVVVGAEVEWQWVGGD